MAEQVQKAHILIVDDEDAVRQSLADFLSERMACDIFQAKDGLSALGILREKPIDLMILDIKMPGISGIDVIKKTKEITPELMVLVMTKWDSSHVVEAAMKAGAVDYIPKPISMKEFGPKVKELLARKGRYFPAG